MSGRNLFLQSFDRKEVQEWIDVAKKKDIGTIAMKTMGGVGRAAHDEKFKKLLADPKYQGSTPRPNRDRGFQSDFNRQLPRNLNRYFLA